MPATPGDTLLDSGPPLLHTASQLFVLRPPTHAAHTGDGSIQKLNLRKGPDLSNVQKATKNIQQEMKRVQWEYFDEQFDIFLEKQFNELSAFAEQHDKKVEYLQKLISMSSYYKQKRTVNLENAKLHAKLLEVNEGHAQGNCAKLPELRQLVKEDPALQNLSEEAEEMPKDDLLTMQDLKEDWSPPYK